MIFGVFLHIVCNSRNYFFHHIIIFFSCRLFERYLPRFFQGAPEKFRNRAKREGDGNVIDQYKENVRNHPDISKDAKELLRQHVHFSREIEFYEFAWQRFHKQAQFLT